MVFIRVGRMPTHPVPMAPSTVSVPNRMTCASFRWSALHSEAPEADVVVQREPVVARTTSAPARRPASPVSTISSTSEILARTVIPGPTTTPSAPATQIHSRTLHRAVWWREAALAYRQFLMPLGLMGTALRTRARRVQSRWIARRRVRSALRVFAVRLPMLTRHHNGTPQISA